MEKLRKLPKNEFNENLREVYKLDEKVEQFYSKPESEEELERRVGIIRSIPEDINTPKVLLKLGNPDQPDKFVYMQDQDGRDYVIALPLSKQAYHRDIANFCRRLFNKELKVLGGGWTHVEDGSLIIHGQSEGFGEADKFKVKEIIQQALPDLEVKITLVSEENKDKAEKKRSDDYNNALEKINGEVGKDLYADVIHAKGIRMGYDLTMLPRPVIGAEEEMSYMVYRSENGSSFGVDTVYLGYKDKDGSMNTKEIAQTRWNLQVTNAEVKDNILTIDIKTEENQTYQVSKSLDSLSELETLSNLNDTEKILLEMYKGNQAVYASPELSRVWHDFVH